MKDLVLGQAKINESLTKKLTTNDKILENINSQIEGLTSAVKNQLSFNKLIETQLAQIAAAIPIDSNGKIPAQPEKSLEKINAVTILTSLQKKQKGARRPNLQQHKKKRKRTRRGNGIEGLHRHQLPTVSHKEWQAGHGRAIHSFC